MDYSIFFHLGADNYNGYLTDEGMGNMAYAMERDVNGNDVPLNAAYYHRWFRVIKKGAGGLTNRIRGFSDENLFMAMTSNTQVVPAKFEICEGRGNSKECWVEEQRWTYAFPLEIVYMTPLSNWNPHGIIYHGDVGTPEADMVTANGRNGRLEVSKAFNGANSKTFYITPAEFYDGSEVGIDAADTTKSNAGVLDATGEMHVMRATGHRIFLPNIPGCGELRTRYPIMPIHGEGSTVWKELAALTDIVMNPSLNSWMIRNQDRDNDPHGITLLLNTNTKNAHTITHSHEIYLSAEEVVNLQAGQHVWIDSETSNGHEHRVKLQYYIKPNGNGVYKYMEMRPFEAHPRSLLLISNSRSARSDLSDL